MASELDWLVGQRFQSLVRREYDWVMAFDADASITVTCLWRLIESGRVRFTSLDDAHQFGLPARVDAAAEVNARLPRAIVEKVELRKGILDLELQFTTGHLFQIIPDSAGYEAWNAFNGNRQFIAIGGGELAIFDG